MGEIEFDFNLARQAVQQIEETAVMIGQMVLPDFRDTIGTLSEAWGGEQADRFLKVAYAEADSMERAKTELENAGMSIKEAVQTARQTEEKAKELKEDIR